MTMFKPYVDFKAKYTLGEVLGRGTYAEVVSATDKDSGEEVAVKVIKVRNPEEVLPIEQEIKVLVSLDNPHIIKLIGVYVRPPRNPGSKNATARVFIVMERVYGGELFDKIVEEKLLSEDSARSMIKTVLECLQFMHAKGIVHRDLKPENILLADKSANSAIKIADFGLSRIFDPMRTAPTFKTMCGTPMYVAPEVIERTGHGVSVDVWSTGVILYIMLCGFPPFHHERRQILFKLITKGEFDFPSPYWDDISSSSKDLITNMLKIDPEQRITVSTALEHPWFQADSSELQAKISTVRHGSFNDKVQAQIKWRRYTNTMVAVARLANALKSASLMEDELEALSLSNKADNKLSA